MKKKWMLAVMAMAATIALPATQEVEASDNSDEIVVVEDGMTLTFEGQGLLYDMYLNGDMEQYIEEMQESYSMSATTRAPAPQVSSARVSEVYSTQGGREVIPVNQYATNRDHGGEKMQVVTRVIGYGRESAKYAGTQVYSTESMHIDLNNDRIVDGWMNVWDVSGISESGQFYDTVRSTNFPYTAKGAWVNIK